MDKLSEKQLEAEGIISLTHEGEKYFSSEQALSKHPDFKINVVGIRTLDYKGNKINFVRAIDIHRMNDFDRMIKKTIDYNPSAKRTQKP